MKYLIKFSVLCLMLCLSMTALAQDVVATWDFRTMTKGTVNIQGSSNTGTVASDVADVNLYVDATNSGKLYSRGTDAQFNSGTIIEVPVKSSRDIVTVVSYPNYHFYTINETAAEADSVEHKATTAEVAQKYVKIVATGGSYLYCIRVKYVSAIQEKKLYDTDFTDWDSKDYTDYSSTSAAAFEQTKTTKYTKETLTFTSMSVGSYPTDASKITDNTGYIEAGKYTGEVVSEAYIETSALASIKTVSFSQYATGGKRGWNLYAKGDGDTGWVLLSDAPVSASKTITPITVDVDRTNVQLRFTNLAPAQNAYMTELHITGNVDTSTLPMLGSFTANGTTYQAADVCDEDEDGNNVANIEISKTATMVSKTENPVAFVVDNGTLGEAVYVTNADKSVTVTIPVSLDGTSKVSNYIINFVWKPDYTVTYYDYSGENVIATQTVEKDATITELNNGSEISINTGENFRGWLISKVTGQKATTSTVVTGDLSLYALITDIEGNDVNERDAYNLRQKYFYPEDHEAIDLSTATYSYNDNTHGIDFKPDSKITLTVAGNATIYISNCKYGKGAMTLSDSKGTTLGTIEVPTTDGTVTALKYTGDADKLVLNIPSEVYIHYINIVNYPNTEGIVKNSDGYYVVKAGDANSFLNIMDAISTNEDGTARTKVFLPNGTYDLGQTTEYDFPVNNISIIGQSMDNTIILTTPDKSIEGLGSADLFFNTKQNIYFQDLTLKNALDYYASGSAGRAAVMQDRGTRTIYKNVKMLSYQDTYYSQNNAQQSYFENCDIHGTVDFICGGGDVRFQNSTISLEPRATDGTGGRTITAPTTTTTYGYIFDGCKVVDLAEGKGDWNFGRTWQNKPICVYLNTTLDDNAAKTIIDTRWTPKGMNNTDPYTYGEYNTTDINGNDITPSGNIITSYSGEFQTIFSPVTAQIYTYAKMFTDWDPKELATQVATPAVQINGSSISWASVEGAIAYAVFNNGVFVTTTSSTSYTVTDGDINNYSVRAANSMGGFGEASTTTTAINNISNNSDAVSTELFSVDGMKISTAKNGVNIIKKTYSDGTVKTSKVIVK